MKRATWWPLLTAYSLGIALSGCSTHPRPQLPDTPLPVSVEAAPGPTQAARTPEDPVAALIAQSEQHFAAGQREFELGHLGQAKHEFDRAIDVLLAHNWPGNVRQLRSVIRRAVLLADDMITEPHLGMECASHKPVLPYLQCDKETQDTAEGSLTLKEIKHRKIVAVEREILAQVLRETGGNKAKAARLLHIDYKTIYSKVRRYGLSVGRKEV